MKPNQSIGHILLAHGSRDPLWKKPLIDLKQTIQTHCQNQTILLAYLELSTPSLTECCQVLIKKGVTQIEIYPLFFATGQHLRVDVPNILNKLKEKLNITINLHDPIGQHKKVQQAIINVMLESHFK